MQIAQRILLIVSVIGVVLVCCMFVTKGRAEKCTEQWETIRVEEFLQQVLRRQALSMEEYIFFLDNITYLDDTAKINLEVYQKEWDIEGNSYFFLILQEEIKKILEEEKRMELETGSIIKVEIYRGGKQNVYYTVLPGKGYK